MLEADLYKEFLAKSTIIDRRSGVNQSIYGGKKKTRIADTTMPQDRDKRKEEQGGWKERLVGKLCSVSILWLHNSGAMPYTRWNVFLPVIKFHHSLHSSISSTIQISRKAKSIVL